MKQAFGLYVMGSLFISAGVATRYGAPEGFITLGILCLGAAIVAFLREVEE